MEQSIPLILVVENHWLAGRIGLEEQRVLDLLNDPNTDFLRIEDVRVFSSSDRGHCLATLPSTVVPKQHLFLAIIPTDRYEIPRKQRIHKIISKQKVDVVTVGAGYFVKGDLHLARHCNDAQHVLSNMLPQFFPITSASVSGPGAEPISAAAVLANKDFVSSISCGHSDEQVCQKPAATPARDTAALRGDSITAQLLADSF